MQAYEFTATLTLDGKVEIPRTVSEKLPVGRSLRLIVLVADEEEVAWQTLTTARFLAGYADADSIYDIATA